VASQRQRQAARKNVKKAQSGARQKKTITKLSEQTRSDLGREGAKAAARKRGASSAPLGRVLNDNRHNDPVTERDAAFGGATGLALTNRQRHLEADHGVSLDAADEGSELLTA